VRWPGFKTSGGAGARPAHRGTWLAAGVAAVLAGGSVLVAAAPPASAQDWTVEFGYAGEFVYYPKMPITGTAEVSVIGGHGGETGGSSERVSGGDGALVTGLLPVTYGETLKIYVAGRGQDGNGSNRTPGAGGWGARGFGGRGGDASGLFGQAGAGGGGASAIERGSQVLVMAGGGGGGAGHGFDSGIDIAGPGGSSGGSHGADPGHDGKGPGRGKGGAGGSEPTGAGGGGGHSSYSGGGGGGGGSGLKGGAGGGGGGFGGGGGGGGGAGSWHHATELADAHVSRGSTSDGNGVVTITYLVSKDNAGASAGTRAQLLPRDAQSEAITAPPTAGSPVQLQADTGSAAQVWKFTDGGAGSGTEIVSAKSGLCLGVARLAAGSTVIASTCDGASTQKWAQAGEHNGSYELLAGGPRDTTLALTGQNGGTGVTVGPPKNAALHDWLEVAP
jgi:Ricin-type beta-trefoil lectin domain